jgi:hypothetical protein
MSTSSVVRLESPRRPQKGWADQKLRWIERYWKGPDMAAVIERAYRLKP